MDRDFKFECLREAFSRSVGSTDALVDIFNLAQKIYDFCSESKVINKTAYWGEFIGELSTRAKHVLENNGISTFADILQRSDAELLRMENFGKGSLDEVKAVLVRMGLKNKSTISPEMQKDLDDRDSLTKRLKSTDWDSVTQEEIQSIKNEQVRLGIIARY